MDRECKVSGTGKAGGMRNRRMPCNRTGRNRVDGVWSEGILVQDVHSFLLHAQKKQLSMKLTVLLHTAPESGFWSEVPALPGCVSEGDSFDETMANIREAAERWLEVVAERTLADARTQVVNRG